MNECKIRNKPAKPFISKPFWMVMGIIWLDLSLTMVGIVQGYGTEANPFFVWFTETGQIAMLGGIALYYAILFMWFWVMPGWIRAITAGFLTSIHIFGAMSWARFWFDGLNFFFQTWYILVGAALLGSMLTFWTYVDVRTCPLPDNKQPGTIDFIDN